MVDPLEIYVIQNCPSQVQVWYYYERIPCLIKKVQSQGEIVCLPFENWLTVEGRSATIIPNRKHVRHVGG